MNAPIRRKPTPRALTQKQLDVLRAYEQLTVNDIAPTLTEVARHLGRQLATVHRSAESLCTMGYMSASRTGTRRYRVIKVPDLVGHMSMLIERDGLEAVQAAFSQAKTGKGAS